MVNYCNKSKLFDFTNLSVCIGDNINELITLLVLAEKQKNNYYFKIKNMKCLIIVNVAHLKEENLGSVVQIMKENGGEFAGNFEKGVVEIKTKYGRFESNYYYKNNNLQLIIIQKPLVIPSTMLKNKILKFFVNYNLDNLLSIFEEKLTFA